MLALYALGNVDIVVTLWTFTNSVIQTVHSFLMRYLNLSTSEILIPLSALEVCLRNSYLQNLAQLYNIINS